MYNTKGDITAPVNAIVSGFYDIATLIRLSEINARFVLLYLSPYVIIVLVNN